MKSYDCLNLGIAIDINGFQNLKSKVGHLAITEKLSLIMG